MGDITGEPPALHGTIVGFGTYHYKYASGREGDADAIEQRLLRLPAG